MSDGRCEKHDNWHAHCQQCCREEARTLRARVAELEDDFAKRQASHCCPTWNDQMEDCDCDERMGGHIARWQEAEAEVARLRKEQAESEHDEQQWNDMLRAESEALAKGTDAWLRQVLGHDWNKLWGPNLEALGRGVDELRAEVARLRESEARLRAALDALVPGPKACKPGVVERHLCMGRMWLRVAGSYVAIESAQCFDGDYGAKGQDGVLRWTGDDFKRIEEKFAAPIRAALSGTTPAPLSERERALVVAVRKARGVVETYAPQVDWLTRSLDDALAPYAEVE